MSAVCFFSLHLSSCRGQNIKTIIMKRYYKKEFSFFLDILSMWYLGIFRCHERATHLRAPETSPKLFLITSTYIGTMSMVILIEL